MHDSFRFVRVAGSRCGVLSSISGSSTAEAVRALSGESGAIKMLNCDRLNRYHESDTSTRSVLGWEQATQTFHRLESSGSLSHPPYPRISDGTTSNFSFNASPALGAGQLGSSKHPILARQREPSMVSPCVSHESTPHSSYLGTLDTATLVTTPTSPTAAAVIASHPRQERRHQPPRRKISHEDTRM